MSKKDFNTFTAPPVCLKKPRVILPTTAYSICFLRCFNLRKSWKNNTESYTESEQHIIEKIILTLRSKEALKVTYIFIKHHIIPVRRIQFSTKRK